MPSPTLDQLKRAIAIQEEIQKLESELAAVLGGTAPAAISGTVPAKRKYTKKSATAEAPADAKPKKAKRTMSPEGRARIIAAQKARWAKIKKGK